MTEKYDAEDIARRVIKHCGMCLHCGPPISPCWSCLIGKVNWFKPDIKRIQAIINKGDMFWEIEGMKRWKRYKDGYMSGERNEIEQNRR